jgi:hypothetical protein
MTLLSVFLGHQQVSETQQTVTAQSIASKVLEQFINELTDGTIS